MTNEKMENGKCFSLQLETLNLFISKRSHRIYFSSRGEPAPTGCQSHSCIALNDYKSRRIGCANRKQQARQHPSQCKRSGEPNPDADKRQRHTLSDHKLQHIGAFRAHAMRIPISRVRWVTE